LETVKNRDFVFVRTAFEPFFEVLVFVRLLGCGETKYTCEVAIATSHLIFQ
jgi:hypothetical protein